jgi:hypothetical protein
MVVLSACQSPNKEIYANDINPGCSARERRLEILGQTPVVIEPGQGALDHPAARQRLKAGCGGGALDDLDRPVAEFGQRLVQLSAVVDGCRQTDGATTETRNKSWMASITSPAPSRSWMSELDPENETGGFCNGVVHVK